MIWIITKGSTSVVMKEEYVHPSRWATHFHYPPHYSGTFTFTEFPCILRGSWDGPMSTRCVCKLHWYLNGISPPVFSFLVFTSVLMGSSLHQWFMVQNGHEFSLEDKEAWNDTVCRLCVKALTDTRWPATEKLCKMLCVWPPKHARSDLCTAEPAVSSSCSLPVTHSFKPTLIEIQTVLLLCNNSTVMTEIGACWTPAKEGLSASWHIILCNCSTEMIAQLKEGSTEYPFKEGHTDLFQQVVYPLCETAGCGHRTLLLIACWKSSPHISPHPMALLF